jgi:hypothetical protein
LHCRFIATGDGAAELSRAPHLCESLTEPHINAERVAFGFTIARGFARTVGITFANTESDVCRKRTTTGHRILHEPGAGRFLVLAAV